MTHVDDDGVELKTDVLVIGGGPSAAWAAIAARERGADVVVVDKGYVGASGALAASTAGYKVVPPFAELRDPVKFERYAMGATPTPVICIWQRRRWAPSCRAWNSRRTTAWRHCTPP
ncbi:MAG: FAD-dependent oxidoreductase [Polyangiales bacterium]